MKNKTTKNKTIKITQIKSTIGKDKKQKLNLLSLGLKKIGNSKTMEDAFSSVKSNGGLCILAGNLPFGQKISIDPFDLIKGKNIIGTWGGETSPEKDTKFYIKKYFSGEMDLRQLITHEYEIEKINEGFADLENGKVGRALIKMGK